MLSRASGPLSPGPFWRLSGAPRRFSCTPNLPKKSMPSRPKIDESEFTKKYLKGSGPGGQKINKTSSAVQLIHKTTGIVVKCQQTRSRSQNLKLATQSLADRIEQLEKGDQSRAAIVGAVKKKRKASKLKKSRRKYRALEEEKMEQEKSSIDGESGEVDEECAEEGEVEKDQGLDTASEMERRS